MTFRGTVKGNTIQIHEHLPLPEGTSVMVSVSPTPAGPERGSREALAEAFRLLPALEPGDVDELERVIEESRLPLSKPCRL